MSPASSTWRSTASPSGTISRTRSGRRASIATTRPSGAPSSVRKTSSSPFDPTRFQAASRSPITRVNSPPRRLRSRAKTTLVRRLPGRTVTTSHRPSSVSLADSSHWGSSGRWKTTSSSAWAVPIRWRMIRGTDVIASRSSPGGRRVERLVVEGAAVSGPARAGELRPLHLVRQILAGGHVAHPPGAPVRAAVGEAVGEQAAVGRRRRREHRDGAVLGQAVGVEQHPRLSIRGVLHPDHVLGLTAIVGEPEHPLAGGEGLGHGRHPVERVERRGQRRAWRESPAK